MVVIDGFSLLFLPGGIKSYLLSILAALNTSKQAQGNSYIVLIPKIARKNPAFIHDEVQELEKSLGHHIIFQYVPLPHVLFALYALLHFSGPLIRRYTLYFWEHVSIPHQVKKLHPTTVFHPYQAVSNYKTASKKIVVVHDVFHWVENDQYSSIVKYMYDTYKKGCIEADDILTISQSAKDEIIRVLHMDKEKVTVVYEGIDNLFLIAKQSEEKMREIISHYTLPKKYIFGMFSLRTYKNTRGVIEVFARLSKKDPELQLVLYGWAVGSENPYTEYINAHNLQDRIVFISQLRSHEDLVYLYSLSYIFLFLSYKEGFGLPPIEAVVSRTLAIVSNVSALGEIYNQILPSFAPDDYDGIAQYILTLSSTKRQECISSARESLLSQYTWKDVLPRYLAYLT